MGQRGLLNPDATKPRVTNYLFKIESVISIFYILTTGLLFKPMFSTEEILQGRCNFSPVIPSDMPRNCGKTGPRRGRKNYPRTMCGGGDGETVCKRKNLINFACRQ